jgi:hypothetical protein
MGEFMAFCNNYQQISYNTAVDEANIELLIIGQGLHFFQTPEAIVFNRDPENIRDFLMQYQRINIGHLIGKDTLDVNIK